MKNTDDPKALIVQDSQDLLVSINRAAISAMSQQMVLLKEFVKGQLVEGEDYGAFGGAKKSTLLKAGAEKLKRLFNLGDRILEIKESNENGAVKYRYTIEAYSLKTGVGIAQCVGIASSHEKPQWSRDPLKFENSISKIAQKRAMVGAVIVATNASDFFTQDLEDGVIEVERSERPSQADYPPVNPNWANEACTEPQRKKLFAMASQKWGADTKERLENLLWEMFADKVVKDGIVTTALLTKSQIQEVFARLEK